MSGSRRTRRGLGAVGLLALTLAACGGNAGTKQPVEETVTYKLRMAGSMMNAGRVSEALDWVDQAIESEPANAGIYNVRGQYCLIAGRLSEAEAAFSRALEVDPHLTDAHNNLGAVYDQLGRKDEAERHFLRALEDPAYPTPEKVRLNLGLLYESQGRDREALESLRAAVEIDPKYYTAHFALGSLLDRLGQLDEAAREYEVAAPAYASNGDYHYRLGFVYHRVGEAQRAKEHLYRVRTVAPGSPAAAKADALLQVIDQ
jgi:type IV pilus assembly protein PilF